MKECKKGVWNKVIEECKARGPECGMVKGCAEEGFVDPSTGQPLIGSEKWPLGEAPRHREEEINDMFGDKKAFRKAMKCVGRRVNQEYGADFDKCYGQVGNSSNAAKANKQSAQTRQTRQTRQTANNAA